MVAFTKHDLQFILDGIIVSETHAAATNDSAINSSIWAPENIETSRQILLDLIPNSLEPIGMRTLTGELNNLVIDQDQFGAVGEFPRLLDPVYRDAEFGTTYDPLAPPPPGSPDFAVPGDVTDSQPRVISNLIVDQSVNNPVAVHAAGADAGVDGVWGTADDVLGDGVELINPDGVEGTGDEFFLIPNTAPDEGLSAPFNSWMTFFGQFFDHGLDLVQKGGSGTVFIPLQEDDPLFDAGDDGIAGNDDDGFNFMVVTRATVSAGPDGIFGDDPSTPDDESLDDTDASNFTSPFVDQNQTYTSHPSHQIWVREYSFEDRDGDGLNEPYATGHLLEGDGGGLATWGDVKEQALELGFVLTDVEGINIPLFAVDQYGEFIPGANGFPQLVMADGTLVEGDPSAPVEIINNQVGGADIAPRTGFSFLLDIAHDANPVNSMGMFLTRVEDGNPNDDFTGGPTAYDGDLLDAHYIAGDGRANENIALTAVHHVFHQEHNRVVEHTKEVLLSDLNNIDLATADDPAGAQAALDLLNGYLLNDPPFELGDTIPTDINDASLIWDGDRLFQAAKFATEMQYQHLVFEEFGRKVQPLIDLFASYETSIDASIVAEFAHTVYRFGHSMLTENVDLIDSEGNLTEVGLIEAFLNPIGFNHLISEDGSVADGDIASQDSSIVAGALARGLTREAGNEIDEFVTEALRNNLLGLPLDLAAINIARGRETGVPSLNEARADFFEGTGDTKLRPYDSWVDFALNMKNGGASIVNFIAAYGQHELITSQTTLIGQRAAAFAITTGQDVGIEGLDGIAGTADDLTTAITAPPVGDRLDFLNSTGAWATQETGLNLVDFWIGGLAEATEPFGGMLGSTFNFVFEQQMEDLQDGDRFYYLGRTAGLNFLSQLEENSFANMIIRNTDIGDTGADHLPGDIFATPAWILEVDQTRQLTGLGVDGRDDPTGEGDSGGELNPFLDLGGNSLVIRENPDGSGGNYLQYTGGDHVVLGGTDENDTLVGGIGDDTLWGDDGDDNLEGGDGGDILLGGAGDDIITDIGGPNNLQGQDGNDAIFAGGGEALILGGAGQDFILQGPDFAETFGGLGNDFIHAGDESNIIFGNEGDDWLEGGGGNNLLQGDNGDPFLNSTAGGNDVFISGLGDDDYDSEGGDDIMEGADGVQRFEGLNGFDWATYKDVDIGVSADMLLRAFDETPLPPSNVSIMDRFDSVEGLSGSRGGDILRGSNQTDIEITALNNGNNSVLRNFDLIDGLRGADAMETTGSSDVLFDFDVTEWGEGDIILGGAGSDLIEGRAGNDIIDGDLKLDVALGWTARNDAGEVIATGRAREMQGELIVETGTLPPEINNLQEAVFARVINPGDIEILREIIREETAADIAQTPVDTAEFSDVLANYTIEETATGEIGDGDGDGFIRISHDSIPGANDGLGADGVDMVRGIERLLFADGAVDLGSGNDPAGGQPTFFEVLLDAQGNEIGTVELTQPIALAVGQTIRVTPEGITDLQGFADNPAWTFEWQFEEEPGSGSFADFEITNGSGEVGPLSGATIEVPAEAEGFALRVKATFVDGAGVIETVFSDPTGTVGGTVSTEPTEGDDTILGTNLDDDGVTAPVLEGLGGDDLIMGLAGDDILVGGSLTAESNAGNDILDGGEGTDTAVFFGDPTDITAIEFAIGPDEADPTITRLEVVDVATGEEDLLIDVENVEFRLADGSVMTFPVAAIIANLEADPEGDPLFGLLGNVITGTPGDDLGLDGTGGADAIAGLAGNDVIRGLGGDDSISGGEGNDNIRGNGGDDQIRGDAGDDIIRGGNGDDVILGGTGEDELRGGAGFDILDGGDDADLLLGGRDDDELTGGAGDDDVRGNGGDDTIFWAAGDGRDLVNGGGGADRIRITGSDADETFFIETVDDYTVRTGVLASTLAANTEIVVSRSEGGGADTVIAELDNIEDIDVSGLAGNDTFVVSGDFAGTSLDPSTITIDGSDGNDTVNISNLTSEHRIVFNTNGGEDTIIGDIRPQDTVNSPFGSTMSSNGDGSTSISDANTFSLTDSDLTQLLNLVRGLPSNLAEDHATGIRDLEGTGNNLANPDYGAADQPFIRLTDARYGAYDEAAGNRSVNPIFDGLDPREISNILGTQESDLPTSAEEANTFFMAFGQYLDHGLDFLPKGGNGTITIDGADVHGGPPGSGNFADLTRGSVDHIDSDGIPHHNNQASPFVDQNQAYGSTELVGQFLREGDGNGGLGGRLLSGGPDPSNPEYMLLPTMRELILHHWENDTVFSDPVHMPAGPMSFRTYFSDLPYTNSAGEDVTGTLVNAGVINEDMIPYFNSDFMGSGYTLVGDANPFINLLDHYVAGDLRANENYALTSIHTIWARNHNYHAENLEAAGFDGTAEELFQAAKILNESEYQRVVFGEFADQLLGGMRGSGSHGHDDYNPGVDARISHEFAAAAYRFGHSLISQTFTVIDENGQPQQVPLTDAFLNPTNDADAFDHPLPPGYNPQPGYEQRGVNGVVEGIAGQPAEEVDYNVVDAVRDDLVRLRADLFSFNVARGWDVGLGTLNQVRAGLMNSDDPYVMEAIDLSGEDLNPYSSWEDFASRNGLSPAILAQFMAAYPDLVLQTPEEIAEFQEANPDIELTGPGNNVVRGIDRVDFWVGGLAEEHIRGGMVGSTFWVVLHEQFDRLQEGDRFYYTDRVEDFDFYEQVEDQSFSDIIARNTGLEGLPEDIFTTDADRDDDQDGDGDGDSDGDDSGDGDGSGDDQGTGDDSGSGGSGSSTSDEPMTLIGGAAADIMIGGSASDMIAGNGADDTLLSGSGNDTVAGGDGDDNIIGGAGNDILIGDDGDDTIVGNDGDDFILGGDGGDQILAGEGDDWIDAGADRDVVDAGAGNDTVVAGFGDGNDVYRGGDGIDTYDMAAVTSDVEVDLGLGLASSTQSGVDTLSDFENVITGAGNDTIVANSSTNVLTGGAGNDTFVFNSIADADGTHITDFAPGDTIDLSGIASNYSFAGDGNFDLLGEGATFSQAGQLIVRSDGDDLIVEGDVDGDSAADFAIRVSGKPELDPTDFNGV